MDENVCKELILLSNCVSLFEQVEEGVTTARESLEVEEGGEEEGGEEEEAQMRRSLGLTGNYWMLRSDL